MSSFDDVKDSKFKLNFLFLNILHTKLIILRLNVYDLVHWNWYYWNNLKLF